MINIYRNRIIIITLFSMFIALSCNSKNEDSSIKNEKEANKELIKPQRENPFLIRDFNPYLNEKWIGNAACYGFYRKGQAPGKKGPSEEEILEDLEIISNYWNMIRIYNADEDSELVLKMIKKNNLPIKVMLGIWLENESGNKEKEKSNLKNIHTGLEFAERYNNEIIAVCVGNETQVDWSTHKMNQDKFIEYVRMVRQNTDLPVTTSDDYLFWVKDSSRKISEELDFVTTHIHPSWNGISLENSINWIDSIYKKVQEVHSNKLIVIGESGWPTDYDSTKTGPAEQGTLIKGEISVAAQENFIIMFKNWLYERRVISFLFEVFDEAWKGGGELSNERDVEKNWGVFYENRKAKIPVNIL